MKKPRASRPIDVMRARAEGDRLARELHDLPIEVKREMMAEIDAHAPELREWITAFQAAPLRFTVTDGNERRDVISTEIIRRHSKQRENES